MLGIVRHFIKNISKAAWRWQLDDGWMLSAAVAYYAALSFFPLLLVGIAAFGFVLQYTQGVGGAEEYILNLVAEKASPGLALGVEDALDQIKRKAAIGGPAGIATLLITGLSIFVYFDDAFARIWNVERTGGEGVWPTIRYVVVYRLKALVMLFGMGLLLVLTFFASLAVGTVLEFARLSDQSQWWKGAQILVSVALNTLYLTVLYRVLPKSRVHTSEALHGGLFVAIVWEIGRQLLGIFLIGSRYNAYGLVGSFIALMLWIYYAICVLFLGAEYVQVICRECDPVRHKGAS